MEFDANNQVPAGATIGGSSGVFSWTPTGAQGPGTYKFKVSVSDAVTSTAQTIVLTVSEVNTAPVLSGVPASATIPESAAYTFTASATDADIPVQTLTFSLTDFDASNQVPVGAVIGGSSGVFSWTPTEAQGPGTYKFNVSVSDGVTSTFQAIVLTVSEVNAAPVLSGVPASATIPELAAYTFTASATDADIPVQTLTFSLTDFDANNQVPAGAVIGGSSGVFSWTPAEAQGPGTYKFNVSVSDGVTSAVQTLLLTVSEVNTAPLPSGVPASATIPELAAYTFTAGATDADQPAQTLIFSLTDFDASNTVPAGATIDVSTGVFNWTPTETQGPGTYKFNVSVSDGVTSAVQTIVLTVTEVNSVPVLSGMPANATIPQLATYTFTASATDADFPAQTLTFSLTDFDANNKVPPGAVIGVNTGVFNWTPTETQGPGTYKFNVSVSDGVTSSFQTIVLTVSEVNASPVLSGVPASATIPELAAYTFTASATDSDLPAQTLAFSLTDFDASNQVPAGATIDASTGLFSWTPTEAQGPGTYKFNVSVNDGLDSTAQTIVLTVTEVNSAPVLSGVPASATIPELAAYTFTASATDSDVPVQTLTFSLVDFDASNKVPAGATIGGSSGVFNWTPTGAQGPGTYKFKVSVSDGVTSTAQTIVLTVSEVNTAPVLSGVPASATIPELAAYTFTASATDADLPAQTLTFSLMDFDANNQVPAGATIGGSTGVFSWTPTEAQGPGTYKFKVSVSDGVTSTAQTIVLTVSEVNTAPVVSGVPASATIPESAAYTFTASATDADIPVQTLTFSLTDFDASNKVPAGATIGGSTGRVQLDADRGPRTGYLQVQRLGQRRRDQRRPDYRADRKRREVAAHGSNLVAHQRCGE